MLPTARAGVAAAITLTMTLATGSSAALADHFQPGGSAVPNRVPRPTAVTATSPLRSLWKEPRTWAPIESSPGKPFSSWLRV